jgi:uncharacterized protein YceH (UPF0502 family)
VLVEKERTVPDTYPLTLNALVSGCNQKNSRDPVISATDAEVQSALDHLKSLSLAIESSGGRVMRYAHNTGRVLRLPPQSVALLATLFLRGPQTVGELRINSDRLHKFGDISAVEAFLQELAERPEGALVRELPRQPGSRENRWAHLLSGEPAAEPASIPVGAPQGDVITVSEIASLRANVDELQAEVESLRESLEKVCAELGLAPPARPGN